MKEIEQVSLFDDEYTATEKEIYEQFKLKSDKDMIKFLKQFIIVEEEAITPYKHKSGYYNKKGHYINGKKVNRYVYKYVKSWLETNM